MKKIIITIAIATAMSACNQQSPTTATTGVSASVVSPYTNAQISAYITDAYAATQAANTAAVSAVTIATTAATSATTAATSATTAATSATTAAADAYAATAAASASVSTVVANAYSAANAANTAAANANAAASTVNVAVAATQMPAGAESVTVTAVDDVTAAAIAGATVYLDNYTAVTDRYGTASFVITAATTHDVLIDSGGGYPLFSAISATSKAIKVAIGKGGVSYVSYRLPTVAQMGLASIANLRFDLQNPKNGKVWHTTCVEQAWYMDCYAMINVPINTVIDQYLSKYVSNIDAKGQVLETLSNAKQANWGGTMATAASAMQTSGTIGINTLFGGAGVPTPATLATITATNTVGISRGVSMISPQLDLYTTTASANAVTLGSVPSLVSNTMWTSLKTANQQQYQKLPVGAATTMSFGTAAVNLLNQNQAGSATTTITLNAVANATATASKIDIYNSLNNLVWSVIVPAGTATVTLPALNAGVMGLIAGMTYNIQQTDYLIDGGSNYLTYLDKYQSGGEITATTQWEQVRSNIATLTK